MKRLAIFAHYDAQDEVKPYVVHHLRELRAVASKTAFVSTSKLGARELAKLAGLVDDTALKDNRGFDFGMWRQIIMGEDLTSWDELILTNSSVFGPLFPLRDAFVRMADEQCDFWGMTDNNEIAWHLQSYFLVFKRSVHTSEPFAQFWQGVLPYKDKWQLIRSYEIGLTTFLVESGFRASAYVPSASLFPTGARGALYGNKKRNPTCYHPISLLRRGMPFVKVELLRDNPCNIRLSPVRREMLQLGYDPKLIAFDRPVRKKRSVR